MFAGFGITAEVIPNIVDLDRFAYRPRGTLRPRILSTRNFEPLYNVACTLRAFRLVQDRHPDATLVLVGAGSQDGPLRQLAADLDLKNVRFAGRVPPLEMWRYYADADIYLQTPNIDNMPASVLEAFASGCAVVATNAGGVPAILTDGLHGLLIECNDHQAAAAGILRLIDEPALSARLTASARESCEQYRWEAVRAQWVALYRGMVHSPDVSMMNAPPEFAKRPRRASAASRAAASGGGAPRAIKKEKTPTLTRAAVLMGRLRTMDAEELRFRVACEARKAAGRVRSAIAPPRWRRSHLSSLLTSSSGLAPGTGSPLLLQAQRSLRDGDWASAHRALASHFATRAPRFPLDPRTIDTLAARITQRFPDAAADASRRAESVLAGRYDLLGYHDLPFGTPPAWHKDPVHNREAPAGYWSAIPYLAPQSGDHKVIWEINRHQHWLKLARAHHLTAEPRYYDAFVDQLDHWLAANPPLQGINWASMLELGFRSLSWIWSLHFFAAAAAGDPSSRTPWIVDLLLALDRQLAHIEQQPVAVLQPEYAPDRRGAGPLCRRLRAPGTAAPAAAASRSDGGSCSTKSTVRSTADGGHAELSTHYHRYSTDFYLLAARAARAVGDDAAPAFEQAALRQATYLRTLADDAGRLPQLGDDDGGQLFPICGREPSDCRDTLAAASVILDEPTLAVSAVPEEVFWMCGALPLEDMPRTSTPWRSARLTDSGYYVSRTAAGDHLVFDAGRHGFLNGGHAHADALSIVLAIGGRPLLIDPGTATYTMNPAARDRYRSTAMHNTLALNGRPQSEPDGPFHWRSRADARLLAWKSGLAFDYAEGIHGGYRPLAHARSVLALRDVGWLVIDHVFAEDGSTGHASVDAFWHVHPDWSVTSASGGSVRLWHRDGLVHALASSSALEILSPEEAGGLDDYAPVYGRIERATCVRGRTAGSLPRAFATFIPAVPLGTGVERKVSVSAVPVTHGPGPSWHAAAFRLSWPGGEAIALSAIEGEIAGTAGGPGLLWGCEDARTDARYALVPVGGVLPGEPVVVHGNRVESRLPADLVRA